MKLIAASIALVAAGQASAALQLGDFNNSSLIFVAWDTVKQVSYTRDLGTYLNDFLANSISINAADAGTPSIATSGNKTPDSGLIIPFAPDALYLSTFAGSLASSINWGVFADDNNGANPSLYRIITTTNGTTGTFINSATNGGSGAIRALMLALNGTNGNCNVSASCTAVNYAGTGSAAVNFGTDINGFLKNDQATLNGFGSQNFFYFAGNNNAPGGLFGQAQKVQFSNAAGPATWTLAADGNLTYAVSAVPLPAAVWMMGAGLLGLIGVGRRRKLVA